MIQELQNFYSHLSNLNKHCEQFKWVHYSSSSNSAVHPGMSLQPLEPLCIQISPRLYGLTSQSCSIYLTIFYFTIHFAQLIVIIQFTFTRIDFSCSYIFLAFPSSCVLSGLGHLCLGSLVWCRELELYRLIFFDHRPFVFSECFVLFVNGLSKSITLSHAFTTSSFRNLRLFTSGIV